MFTILCLLFTVTSSLTLPPKQPSFACEGRYECFKQRFDANMKMLCDGYRACYRAEYHDTKPNKAICNGYQGCEGVEFYNVPKSLSCRGFQACINIGGDKNNEDFKFGMTASDKIDCSGVKACTNIDGGLYSSHINCDGDKACFNTKLTCENFMLSNINSYTPPIPKITCNGKKACANCSQIRSTGTVHCDGDGACENSRIQADLGIKCHGKRVCKNTNLQLSAVLQAYGMMGASGSIINQIPLISGYGFMSLAFSTISNFGTGHNGMIVNGYGYKSLWGAQITCLKDIPCTINCMGNGCQKLIIIAQKSTILTITPPTCMRKTYKTTGALDGIEIIGKFADPAVKATHCPEKLYYGTTPPPRDEYEYNEEYAELRKDEELFESELEKSIADKKKELEEMLFTDANERIEEEKEYMLSAMLSAEIGNLSVEHDYYVIIGWVVLAVVFIIGLIYAFYSYKHGEYKALSS